MGGRGLASPSGSNPDYERSAEMYFTTYEPGGRYGDVLIRGNVFTTGPEAIHAITFAPGGDSLRVTDNPFRGPIRTIGPTTGCTDVTLRGNVGTVDDPSGT